MTVGLLPELALRPRWDLYRTTTSDASGQFQLIGVAPGNYRAFAWEEVERDAWQDTEFMKPIEGRGVPVEVREIGQANLVFNDTRRFYSKLTTDNPIFEGISYFRAALRSFLDMLGH